MTTPAVPSPEELTQLMKVIEGWEAMQLTHYVQTAGHAFIIADYLHTLPDEIRLMWPAKRFSLPKALFFMLRYYIFVHHALCYYDMRLMWSTPTECSRVFLALCISAGLVVLASEVVLFVRVYAFSGRKRKMLIYLIFQFLTLVVSAFALLALFAKRVSLSCPSACHMLAIMLIMVYLAYSKHKGLNSTLLAVFCRDGVYYFACLSVFAIFNSLMGFVAPLEYKFLFIQLEVDLHAVLATRMLLHLRGWSQHEPVTSGVDRAWDTYHTGTTLPPMQFARNEVDTNSVQVMVQTSI